MAVFHILLSAGWTFKGAFSEPTEYIAASLSSIEFTSCNPGFHQDEELFQMIHWGSKWRVAGWCCILHIGAQNSVATQGTLSPDFKSA